MSAMLKQTKVMKSMVQSLQALRSYASVSVGTDLSVAVSNSSLQKTCSWDSTTSLKGIFKNILGARQQLASPCKVLAPCLSHHTTIVPISARRFITTGGSSVDTVSPDASATSLETPRIKFKRLDKTAKHILQILDKEAVEEVRTQKDIPDIKPGYIIQLKVEVPENKRRVSIVKGIVIARRNAGLNTTFRLRRLVAGVGVENLFHLYSPNIKEMKVLDKKKVRRAKLYYLRDKMNALKKH